LPRCFLINLAFSIFSSFFLILKQFLFYLYNSFSEFERNVFIPNNIFLFLLQKRNKV
jgi:hypothetical protein